MRGVTLVELLVVLSIIGLLTGMTALAVGGLHRPAASERAEALSRARAAAVRSGRAISVSDGDGVARFLPDGRGIGAGVDPLTGEALDATR